ncbi:hypothetical protein [Micromonospora rubida]
MARVIGTWPVPAANRIDGDSSGDTIRFGTIDPPTLVQPKIDDRGTSRIPRQRTPQQFMGDGQQHHKMPQQGWNAIADMVKDRLDDAGSDPYRDDLEWVISLIEVRRATDNEELRADLLDVLLNRPPLGEIGDRVVAVYLKHTQRLVDAAHAARAARGAL